MSCYETHVDWKCEDLAKSVRNKLSNDFNNMFKRFLLSIATSLILGLLCLVPDAAGKTGLDRTAKAPTKGASSDIVRPIANSNGSGKGKRSILAAPIISLVPVPRPYKSGDPISVEVIGGAGGGFESYIAGSSINVPRDGKYNIGNIGAPGLYILRFIAQNGEKFDYGVLIIPAAGGGSSFSIQLTSKVGTAEVPVADSNALKKFWGLVNEARIKRAWSDAFPNWLQTQGPGVATIGITCAATITISGGAVIGLCIKEAGAASFGLLAALFSKLADNLLAERAINENEAQIVKAVISALNGAAGFILSNKEKFDAIISGLKAVNDIVLAEHQQLRVTFSLVLDTASRANFMIDVNQRVNP